MLFKFRISSWPRPKTQLIIIVLLSITLLTSYYWITKDRVVRVLLLAYSRSGSSFLGQILSAGDNTTYVYEPLFGVNFTVFEKEPRLRSFLVKNRVEGILNCDPVVIQALPRPELNWRIKECVNSTTRITKTIRARSEDLQDWILKSNIQVVHLVRDPRGMIRSLNSRPGTWTLTESLIKKVCNDIEFDLYLAKELGSRYIRVRYEDLVENPNKQAEKIYQHLGMDYSAQVKKFIHDHTNSDNKHQYKYYSTFRKSDFKPDLWQALLTLEQIRDIESQCYRVMKYLNYKIFDPNIYKALMKSLNNETIQEMDEDHQRYMKFKKKKSKQMLKLA